MQAHASIVRGSVTPEQQKLACSSEINCLSPVIGGDGLSSFNSKLAVLVSEADVGMNKGQTCPFNPAKSPPSLLASPSASMCDGKHHRRMPFLCAPISPVMKSSFPSLHRFYASPSRQKKQTKLLIHLSKTIIAASLDQSRTHVYQRVYF